MINIKESKTTKIVVCDDNNPDFKSVLTFTNDNDKIKIDLVNCLDDIVIHMDYQLYHLVELLEKYKEIHPEKFKNNN